MSIIGDKVEQALHNVQAERERLVRHVADGNGADSLANVLNAIAEAEGYLSTITTVQSIYDGHGRERVTAWLLRTVSNGPDDTWSGRTNDVRRSRFNGILRCVQDLEYWTGE